MVKEIASLERGLAVLDHLDRSGPAGLSSMARETGIAKATLLRILTTLQSAGFARQRLADGQWQAMARRPAAPARGPTRLAEIAGPVLDDLCQRVLWPSDVGVYDGGAIRVLETSRRLSPFLVNRDVISQRIHVLPSAMGRAILAWSAPATRAAIVAALAASGEPHDRGARDRRAIDDMVEATRTRGYAVRHRGYFVTLPREGRVTAIAVPVMAAGEAVAAINLSWVASAMPEADFVAAHIAGLRAAAEAIARDLTG